VAGPSRRDDAIFSIKVFWIMQDTGILIKERSPFLSERDPMVALVDSVLGFVPDEVYIIHI
jgi:hypothetical protein